MAVSFLALVVAATFPVLVVLLLVVVLGRAVRSAPPHGPVEVARRHALGTAVAAWAVGVAGLVLLGLVFLQLDMSPERTELSSAPLVFGLLYVATCGVGELTWPGPTGNVRRARLAPRRTTAPAWLTWLTAAWGVALVTVFVVLGIATDRGYAFVLISDTRSRAVGPFPGWDQAALVLGALALLALVTVVTLRAVAERPAVPGDPDVDRWLRRLSAHRVLRGAQLAVGLALAEVLAVVAEALQGGRVEPGADVLTVFAVVVALTALAAAAVPVRRPLPPPAEASPEDRRPTTDAAPDIAASTTRTPA